MGFGMDNRNVSGLRTLLFFTFLTALIVFLVVQIREQLVLGRITDVRGHGCLVAIGSYENYIISRTTGPACHSSHAYFAARNDLRSTPIIFREAYGPPLCLTDDRRKLFVSLEPCNNEQDNQRWHFSANHILSDGAIRNNLFKRCLTAAMGNLFDPAVSTQSYRLEMQECANIERQLFGWIDRDSTQVKMSAR